jgi:hypothetical protein
MFLTNISLFANNCETKLDIEVYLIFTICRVTEDPICWRHFDSEITGSFACWRTVAPGLFAAVRPQPVGPENYVTHISFYYVRLFIKFSQRRWNPCFSCHRSLRFVIKVSLCSTLWNYMAKIQEEWKTYRKLKNTIRIDNFARKVNRFSHKPKRLNLFSPCKHAKNLFIY